MDNQEEQKKKAWFFNFKNLEWKIDDRVAELQNLYGYRWYDEMLKDRSYLFLTEKLKELKQIAIELWGKDWVKQFPAGIYDA